MAALNIADQQPFEIKILELLLLKAKSGIWAVRTTSNSGVQEFLRQLQAGPS